MNIYILDSSLNIISVLDNFESIIWTERYFGCGDFELTLKTKYDPSGPLKKDNLISIEDSNRLMIIESIKLDYNANEGHKIIISGRSSESILQRRIIWPPVESGSVNIRYYAQSLIDYNIITPEDTNRKITNFAQVFSTDPAIAVLPDLPVLMFAGENLYEVIFNLTRLVGVGFKIEKDVNNKFSFSLYIGKDRSYSQSANNYVIFSSDFENLLSSTYFETNVPLMTTSIVVGEGFEFNSSDTLLWEKVDAPGGAKTGFSRREMFIDRKSLPKTDTTGAPIDPAVYEGMLINEAKIELSKNTELAVLNGEGSVQNMYVYNVDFFLGDYVQLNDDFGHSTKIKITEITITEDGTGKKIYPSFETV